MITVFQALTLAFVQSLTEFLPVSSSAHLFLISWFLRWPEQPLYFDAAMHFGTFLATVIFFRKKLVLMFTMLFGSDLVRKKQSLNAVWKLAAASVPVGVFGALFASSFEVLFRAPGLIALQMMVWGAVLWKADVFASKNIAAVSNNEFFENVSLRSSFLIGLSQILALMPGVSRSGITITSGIFLGLDKKNAAEFSFFAGLPVLFAASLLSIIELISAGSESAVNPGVLVLAIAASFVFGFAVITYFLQFVQQYSLKYFAWYRLALGVVILALIF